MADYNISEDEAYKQTGWTNVITNIPRVLSKEALYQIEGTGGREKRAMGKPD